MLEFEVNSVVDVPALVEFFGRCGWSESEAGAKLEWALAASEEWVLCRLDGEIIGFGRVCRLGPLNRVVFDVLVDARFRGRGLRTEIVRLLSQNAGALEEVSVFLEHDSWWLEQSPYQAEKGEEETDPGARRPPAASADTYLGRKLYRKSYQLKERR